MVVINLKNSTQKEFAVVCPNCKQKDIVVAKKKMASVQAKCRHCETNRWLRFVGEITHFGDKNEYIKIRYY